MGGSYDHLVLLPLEVGGDAEGATGAIHAADGAADTAAATQHVLERFRTFDCKHASCYHEHERQHLLSVIENGFGDLEVFNSVVRHLFMQQLEGGGDDGKSTRRLSTRRSSRVGGSAPIGSPVVPRLGGDKGLEA